MSVCSDATDYVWLTGDEAAKLLDDLMASSALLPTAITRLRTRLSPMQTHLLVEQVDLRRRAAAKFTKAGRMFFTRTTLEQATDEWIAGYKASRFAGRPVGGVAPVGITLQSLPTVVADLCCGIGGDLMALAGRAPVIGVDRDPVAVHFANVNCDVALDNESAERVTLATASAEDFDLGAATAWHIDPDRRAGGKRTTSLDNCQPDFRSIEQFLNGVSNAAIKLAPAMRVPPSWEHRCELEWISRGGECRQLVAWHGGLAYSSGVRRATVVRPGDLNPRTIAGRPEVPTAIAARPDDYVFDVDPAVLAARLKGALAAEYGLAALGSGPTYLTGAQAIADALLSCFEVEEVLPLRVRQIASYLRERSIGRLEIKKRGAEIEPEKLRRELKLRGDNEATLLITPIAGRPAAILARRVASC